MDFSTVQNKDFDLEKLSTENRPLIANLISALETGESETDNNQLKISLKEKIADQIIPVIGITGTGGAGKSSLTDELIFRFLNDIKDINIAIIIRAVPQHVIRR